MTWRMPDLPPNPHLKQCKVCGQRFTNSHQYVRGGTQKKPLYWCRKRACRPRQVGQKKKKTQLSVERIQQHIRPGQKKKLPPLRKPRPWWQRLLGI